MIKYDFQINKDICFAYWIQAMIQWNWYFDEKEFKYYENIIGGFSEEEQKIITEFKKEILEREPDGGYIWLWDRYSNKEIKDQKDKELWLLVREKLGKKFEIIWKEEYPKLIQWQKSLQNYDFKKYNSFFSKIEDFFGEKLDQEIKVQLSLEYRGYSPSGHVKKDFKNLILLNLSSLNEQYSDKLINTLLHETTHLIDYLSNKETLLKNSYLKLIEPRKIEQNNPSWKHLITESVITSIASTNTGDETKLIKFDYKNNKNNYSYQIKSVAYHLKELTKEYLDKNKEMDQSFADVVVKTWLDFRTK